MYGETFYLTQISHIIQASNLNSQHDQIEVAFDILKCLKNILVSLKYITLIITVFIIFSLKHTVFTYLERT